MSSDETANADRYEYLKDGGIRYSRLVWDGYDLGYKKLWACRHCGSIVFDRDVHDQFHAPPVAAGVGVENQEAPK